MDETPMNMPVPLFTTMPDARWAHFTFYGHYPWSDRTVAPWECKPCKEKGTKNVF